MGFVNLLLLGLLPLQIQSHSFQNIRGVISQAFDIHGGQWGINRPGEVFPRLQDRLKVGEDEI
ncbi:hypothetical protein D3C71_2153060 [compost metagenome]